MKTSKRTALSPQQRAHICEAIRHEVALEELSRSNHRRQVWARMAIGLPPRPRRTLDWERRQ
jgi:hypothetical protein